MHSITKAAAIGGMLIAPLLLSATPAAAAPLPDKAFQIKATDFDNVCARAELKAPYRIVSARCDSTERGKNWTYDKRMQQIRNQDPALAGKCLSTADSNGVYMKPCDPSLLFGDPNQQFEYKSRESDSSGEIMILAANDGDRWIGVAQGDTGTFWYVSSRFGGPAQGGSIDPSRNDAIGFVPPAS
ncbi:ricin-type beta-trefoil lectin domain protein [Streptomyces sp. NPDC059999]|uniref:ricin-type beta-trefoil lectin domain protein n=1 Tax=Streptomyces sp. NPDC059999 TaxID=3347030 RepID=UPI003678F115